MIINRGVGDEIRIMTRGAREPNPVFLRYPTLTTTMHPNYAIEKSHLVRP